MKATHSFTDDSAVIRLEGLARPVRMLHLTDTHLRFYDERDGERFQGCVEYTKRIEEYHRERGTEPDPEKPFRQSMALAATQDLDLLALTGDIIHFPSPASVEFVIEQITQLGVPAIYTSGNHDVHYTDEPVNAEIRLTRLAALQPLHNGDPDCNARDIGGIRFVSVDNSVPQLSRKQVDFVKAQLQQGQPTVLLFHWPLSLPTLRDAVIEMLGSPPMMGDPDWSTQSRVAWQVSEDTPETLEFVEAVTTAPNVVAVFCGHVHFAHADAINTRAVQYVGAPGFEGGRRLVEFQPL
ncbi:MAG: metallophosphoesterase [Candidatus Latescibacterota bacterium]|nr:metallophosphoesterase [Candidatus Latescibacterota bacterium]MEC8930144.1 metallophosphoesterase [Candidatus Latescibacterota bacterium]MEC8990968.1 metallophosphoesterase [Candidatus Latescibacterota bacterium]MED5414235.1 metallophosphoesterase [Candidatus Latescibacterota bacterium]MEE3040540.1 metallophosphoesterase [Candidatus Latescibacterota bacterium]